MRRVYRQSLDLLSYTSAKRLGVEVLLTGTNIPEPNKGLEVTHRRLGRLLFLYIDGGQGWREEKKTTLVFFGFFFGRYRFWGLIRSRKVLFAFFGCWFLLFEGGVEQKGGKKGGGDCSIFLYTHGSAIDGDREVGKKPEKNCSAGFTMMRLLQFPR